jgi:hypothetical protein
MSSLKVMEATSLSANLQSQGKNSPIVESRETMPSSSIIKAAMAVKLGDRSDLERIVWTPGSCHSGGTGCVGANFRSTIPIEVNNGRPKSAFGANTSDGCTISNRGPCRDESVLPIGANGRTLTVDVTWEEEDAASQKESKVGFGKHRLHVLAGMSRLLDGQFRRYEIMRQFCAGKKISQRSLPTMGREV